MRRGSLADLREWASAGVRGEVTVVVAGVPASAPDAADALALVLARVEAGMKLSQAVAEVAADTGANRKQLYQAALDQRKANQ